MKKIRVIWKSKDPSSKEGYLRISQRVDGKTKVHSFGLPPIQKKHFNENTQRVRSTFPKYLEYNEKIEEFIKTQETLGESFIVEKNKSLSDFVRKNLAGYKVSTGTSRKYISIISLIEKYNLEINGSSNVKFININVQFVQGWKIWLEKVRGLRNNTISYNAKTFKSFISKADNSNYFQYKNHPFKGIENKIFNTKRDVLDKDDIQKLIDTDIKEVYRSRHKKGQLITDENILTDPRYKHQYSLNDCRIFFLFQFFSGGLRVSDLITLKWKHFNIRSVAGDPQIRFEKEMIKTNESIDVFVNFKTLFLLINYFPKEFKFENEDLIMMNNLRLLKKVFGENWKHKFIGDKNDVDKVRSEHKVEFNMKNILSHHFQNTLPQNIKMSMSDLEGIKKNYSRKKSNTEFDISQFENMNIKDKISAFEKITKLILEGQMKDLGSPNETKRIKDLEKNNEIYKIISKYIDLLSKDIRYSNNFVFPILRDSDFPEVTKDQQFRTLNNEKYRLFANGRSYYNQNLKYVGNQCNITNLKSHTSRHSYASIMIQEFEGVNLYDLKTSLGHKHISTTEKYIQTFLTGRTDKLGKNLSDLFIKD